MIPSGTTTSMPLSTLMYCLVRASAMPTNSPADHRAERAVEPAQRRRGEGVDEHRGHEAGVEAGALGSHEGAGKGAQ